MSMSVPIQAAGLLIHYRFSSQPTGLFINIYRSHNQPARELSYPSHMGLPSISPKLSYAIHRLASL
eukprot:9951770-Prorocentrum_lima.AAC.1